MLKFRSPAVSTMLLLKWVCPRIRVSELQSILAKFSNPSISCMRIRLHNLSIIPVLLHLLKSSRWPSLEIGYQYQYLTKTIVHLPEKNVKRTFSVNRRREDGNFIWFVLYFLIPTSLVKRQIVSRKHWEVN